MKQFLLSLVFLLQLSSYIFGQETEDENENEVEEIVVTGIKSSLVGAIEIKRNNVAKERCFHSSLANSNNRAYFIMNSLIV